MHCVRVSLLKPFATGIYSGFEPSGALMKATIIHAGQAMTGQSNWPGVTGQVTTLNDPTYSLG